MSEGFAVLMAAVISAFIAVVGLVITKEHKISEFRQQWIDGLRADVASIIGAVAANQIDHRDATTYRDIQLRLKELQYRIELRFKLGDPRAGQLLTPIAELIAYGGRMNSPAPTHDLYLLMTRVKEETQKILKDEWERVKKGEKSYCQTLRISKIAAALATGSLASYILLRILENVFLPSISWMVSQFKG